MDGTLILAPRWEDCSPLASGRLKSLRLHQTVTIQFQALFTPLSGSFSAFARATYTLSVSSLYLELEVNPPTFAPDTRLTLLTAPSSSRVCLRGYHSLSQGFPAHFGSAKGYTAHHISARVTSRDSNRSKRLSVALTHRIPIGFFSCGY